MERDAESGLDHTLHHQYASNYGRWLSPDPGGVKVVNLEDPQTRNMYAYVRDSPASLNDPSGLMCISGITVFGSHFEGRCASDGSPPPSAAEARGILESPPLVLCVPNAFTIAGPAVADVARRALARHAALKGGATVCKPIWDAVH
jgi:RHS repeat-associated protein